MHISDLFLVFFFNKHICMIFFKFIRARNYFYFGLQGPRLAPCVYIICVSLGVHEVFTKNSTNLTSHV